MKCEILFSGKNKKNVINLSSAETVQRVVYVNHTRIKFSILDKAKGAAGERLTTMPGADPG